MRKEIVGMCVLALALGMGAMGRAQENQSDDQKKAMAKGMEQYQQMLKGVTSAPDPNAQGGMQMKGFPGADQTGGMQNMGMKMMLSRIPLGPVPNAKDGKAIGLKVEFETGTMPLKVDKRSAPASIQKYIVHDKRSGDRYSVAGQVPVFSWKSGIPVHYGVIGEGNYDDFKRFLTGDISMSEAMAAKKKSKEQQASQQQGHWFGFGHAIHDEASWAKRSELIKARNEFTAKCGQAGSRKKKVALPPMLAGFGKKLKKDDSGEASCDKGLPEKLQFEEGDTGAPVEQKSLSERTAYLMKYALNSPWKMGEELFSGQEETNMRRVYAFGGNVTEGVLLELGKSYSAVFIVLKKPFDANTGSPNACEKLSGCDNFPMKLDPDKQNEYYDAYFVNFQTPSE